MTIYLVTGASGHLGRLAAETLLDAKAGKVIAATRDPAKLNALATRGAEPARGQRERGGRGQGDGAESQ